MSWEHFQGRRERKVEIGLFRRLCSRSNAWWVIVRVTSFNSCWPTCSQRGQTLSSSCCSRGWKHQQCLFCLLHRLLLFPHLLSLELLQLDKVLKRWGATEAPIDIGFLEYHEGMLNVDNDGWEYLGKWRIENVTNLTCTTDGLLITRLGIDIDSVGLSACWRRFCFSHW